MQSRTVKLGAHSVPLRTPPSFALARVVSVALSQSPLLGLGAALGACWGGKPLKASLKAHQHDACAYGAAVVDELHALGFPEDEIWTAAGERASEMSTRGAMLMGSGQRLKRI